jgi:hypothetical protein
MKVIIQRVVHYAMNYVLLQKEDDLEVVFPGLIYEFPTWEKWESGSEDHYRRGDNYAAKIETVKYRSDTKEWFLTLEVDASPLESFEPVDDITSEQFAKEMFDYTIHCTYREWDIVEDPHKVTFNYWNF